MISMKTINTSDLCRDTMRQCVKDSDFLHSIVGEYIQLLNNEQRATLRESLNYAQEEVLVDDKGYVSSSQELIDDTTYKQQFYGGTAD